MTTKLDEAIALLLAEKQRIDDALTALGASNGSPTSKRARAATVDAVQAKAAPAKRKLSPEAKKRIADAQRKRWAAQKAKATTKAVK